MKRGVVGVVLILSLVFGVALGANFAVAAPYPITIYTGSGPGSVYFALGCMFAKVLNQKAKGIISAKGVTSGASVANARAIANGEAQMAIIQNDVTWEAYNGKVRFKGHPVKNMRGIATLYPEAIQIVVRADSKIKTLQDLVGKRVVVGAAGSGCAAAAQRVLTAAGIWNKINKIYQTFSEAAQSLVLGQIDANFTVIAFPAPAVNMTAVRVPIHLIPIPDNVIKKLHTSGYPFYVKVIIPKKTYNGMDRDVQTVAVRSTLVAGSKVPTKIVYDVTKILYTNLDDLAKAHQVAKQIKISQAFDGLMVPLHPGAAKFFKEHGLKIPANLLK
ncbi:MAG: TAXI family TRAP transporter solute-binding subunit [Synergistetes bacterium]|nr:TAXI family TRAP transporter solute-binding subunit [Synergistota bacterium]